MKRQIDAFDYAGRITKALPKGVLLTTACGDEVNTMTIGWGTIGMEWGRPIFIAYVRESRYTKQLLERNPEFTVNIPLDSCDSEIIRLCGTKSGRDTDKITASGLSVVFDGDIPMIEQSDIVIVCKKAYSDFIKEDCFCDPTHLSSYPQKDYHKLYILEIKKILAKTSEQ